MPLEDRIRALPCWRGPVSIEPLPGGLTNHNRLVRCRGESFVVRHGADNPVHGIDRRHEALVSAAAASAGIAPELIFAGDGFLVLRHIAGRTLTAVDLGCAPHRAGVITLLRRCRDELPAFIDFPLADRRPALILRRYQQVLAAPAHPWHRAAARQSARIEALTAALAGRPPGFAHNDIHGGNIIDDGTRLWLIDQEYAGAGDALVDLASLLNNSDSGPDDVPAALRAWSGKDGPPATLADLTNLRLAAALRDLFWGYAQDGLKPGSLEGYIAINEDRVERRASETRPQRKASPR